MKHWWNYQVLTNLVWCSCARTCLKTGRHHGSQDCSNCFGYLAMPIPWSEVMK